MNLGKENEYQEFKKSLSQLDKGLKSLSAMLNRNSEGTVFFGVDDQGEITGIDSSEKTLMKIRTTAPGKPSEMLWDINNTLCADNPSQLFVTAWFGILTISSGELTYSNAGHEYPALMHKGSDYTLLEDENMPPLATVEGLEYKDVTINLQSGDRLFLYTDGVPEAKNSEGQRFGTEKMLAVLNRDRNKTPEELLKDIKHEVDTFTGDNDPFDDITMMSFVWKGK